MSNKDEVKALLARAGVEINNALKRVDSMSASELSEIQDLSGSLRAIFDKNGSCGAASVGDLKAFFDKNGSCLGGLDSALERFARIR
jgi:hypothetical protein